MGVRSLVPGARAVPRTIHDLLSMRYGTVPCFCCALQRAAYVTLRSLRKCKDVGKEILGPCFALLRFAMRNMRAIL